MKDSSADIANFAETVRQVPADFAMMIGNGAVLCKALQAGARGGILAVGCVVPELCIAVYNALQAGKIDRAKYLQENLTPLARAVTKTYGIGGLKTAMETVGLVGGAVRAPLQRPNEAAAAEIGQLINRANQALENSLSDASALAATGSSLAHQGPDA
jgi:dihydrodipicolinate synthase/N-acetylneuraminate lyase